LSSEIAAKGAAAIARLVDAAKSAGVRVILNQVEGASHNAAAWKARFPAAMRFLYEYHPQARRLCHTPQDSEDDPTPGEL
jgi:hypothetical protein